MRSPAEVAFRLRQEAANLWMWRASVPALEASPVVGLPDPCPIAERLQSSAFRAELREVVESIVDGCIPALGLTLTAGPDIRWRRDHVSGIETEARYFRRIPYLDAAQAGDHKVIWELNRHQHLAALAQETLFKDAHPGAAPELFRQLESWLEQNPFQCGINWTSALEVGFRALSWVWIHHYAGPRFPSQLQQRFLAALYQHGLHLEYNLSVYFSPNTHLLGESLALYTLGRCFPQWPRSRRWMETGGHIVEQEIFRQVRGDGSHFEQSAYYHLYATDMFLFYALLAQPGAAYRERLTHMVAYLAHLLGPSLQLPLIGDDDGGRFFHPYGDRTRWAAESWATAAAFLQQPCPLSPDHLNSVAAWWLGGAALDSYCRRSLALSSRSFPDAGLTVWIEGDIHILADAGPFGPGSGGHSHSDTLSVLVRRGTEQVLIDPGTYTYVGDPEWRDRFRGSAAHNTVRIQGRDQARSAGPFRWQRPHPAVCGNNALDQWEGSCAYAGFVHHRSLQFDAGARRLIIEDRIEGPSEPVELEWFWHPGESCQQLDASSIRIGQGAVLRWERSLEAELSEGGEFGWRSPALGVKVASPVLRLWHRVPLPFTLRTVLDL